MREKSLTGLTLFSVSVLPSSPRNWNDLGETPLSKPGLEKICVAESWIRINNKIPFCLAWKTATDLKLKNNFRFPQSVVFRFCAYICRLLIDGFILLQLTPKKPGRQIWRVVMFLHGSHERKKTGKNVSNSRWNIVNLFPFLCRAFTFLE